MKKLFVFVILLLVMVSPIQAQGPIKLYLPLILKEANMGYWSIIVPESTQNMALNPSAETTGNYTAESGTTVTRVTTYQKFGLYSYRIQTNANNEGIEITLSTLSNAIHYVTLHVRGTLPNAWDWSLNDSTFTAPTLIESIDENWNLYGLQFSAAQSNGSTKLSIHQNGTGSGDFYIDGIQVEAKTYWTTYCDGSQDGCYWNGANNASTSTRSELSRAGGRVRDLEDDYDFEITQLIGLGANPTQLHTDSYSTLPGGELNSIDSPERVFTLTGYLIEDDNESVNTKRDNLYSVLNPNDYEQQPVTLRYTGETVQKEIQAYYESGLEGNLEAPGCNEKIALRFIATDPFLYEIGNSAALLDTEDSATFRYVAGRLKSTGQWNNLDEPSEIPGIVTSVQEDASYVYFSGSFADIIRYDKQSGVYSALGTSGANNAISKILLTPNGLLYAIGDFTSIGGISANRIAVWNGSSWSALGSGLNLLPYDLSVGVDGKVYVSGSFTSPYNYLAVWDGSTWANIGTAANNLIRSVLATRQGLLYVGGDFTSIGGTAANRIAVWNGSTWSALATGANGEILALTLDNNNVLYAGGNFTSPGNRIASWNGSSWKTLGTGTNGVVRSLKFGNDGMLYASGLFTSAGGITVGDKIARWNGSTWAHMDINLPGSPTVYAILPSQYVDPVIQNSYDIYLAFSTTGTGTYAGKVTINNTGSIAHPKIIFTRSGGTSAIIETLKNETTGKELLINYSLKSGEQLMIDLTPIKQSITSNYNGSVLDAVLPNSDFGQWNLRTGNNVITAFVNNSGATITAYLQWRKAYSGL